MEKVFKFICFQLNNILLNLEKNGMELQKKIQ